MDRPFLDSLATSLEYPTPGTAATARSAADLAAGDHPDLAKPLWDLAVYLETADHGEPEERYTRLFDMSPVCTLHVGYHLFGDAYERGAFLSNMAAEVREAGLHAELERELPDYLPTVLRLLARVADETDRHILLMDALLPALARMTAALGDSDAPWSRVVAALPSVLGGPLPAREPARNEEVRSHAGP